MTPVTFQTPASHPPTALPESSRGALARDRMLMAALDLFGRHGFEATTTRMVAQQAGMNLGAIPYYFGSKDDLYGQAAAWLADYIADRMREPLAHLQAACDEETDPTALVDHLVRFMQAHARSLLADAAPASWIQFYMRAQTECDAAFERLFEQVISPSHDTVCGVLARVMHLPADHPRTRALAYLAFHQSVCFRLTGDVLLRRLGWDGFTPPRIEMLLETIGTALRDQLLGAARRGAQA
ncbi:CerR family C-terminal domain-containing protein [uncultured Aquabacterium sp.]|jgi:AcrR family transcriptional regulator|uniref:CerR family C-terminal domain-containing protein n=1 Tax=uncultured Aquabacterium sp. TaxID=158753 RepID=UPI0026251B33|nr:CerR family C-terminal domain-containing protein [uncultured Aquabacterium sp.]